MTVDVVVIGGGAAGLMCALRAGKRGRRVVLIEHNRRVGEKILISGGGRCNFTNLHTTPENYISQNPHFCRSALARFTPNDFLLLVDKYKIQYYEKTLGQLFCVGSSKEIVNLLLQECSESGVEIWLTTSVAKVSAESLGFSLMTSRGTIHTSSLVIATGGLSIPKMGATDFGYKIAQQFNLPIVGTRPALVPLTWGESDQRRFDDKLTGLSGISFMGRVTNGRSSFREKVLFTHRGLSGPAILQISSYWSAGEAITIDLLPDTDIRNLLHKRKLDKDRTEFKNVLATMLSRRLADLWSKEYFPSKPVVECANRELDKVAKELHNWQVSPAGTEGFAKAEVTAGGVDTNCLSSQTMECLKVPGLYFIGEVVDVTGHLGGFNFQWAWASGHAAGEVV